MSTHLNTFTPWTDRDGTGNLTGGGGGGTNDPQFYAAGMGGAPLAVDAVYCGTSRYMSRAAATLGTSEYFVEAVFRHYVSNTVSYQTITFENGANVRKLKTDSGTARVKWSDTTNVEVVWQGTAATIDTWLAAKAYSFWRTGGSIYGQEDAGSETSAGSNNNASATQPLRVGANPTNSQIIIAYLATFNAYPGDTVRKRCRNKAMIMTGLA